MRIYWRRVAGIISLLLTCALASPAFGVWKNGGASSDLNHIKFGTHDWIFWRGYLLAKDDLQLKWLNTNVNYAFFGTEAPDLGKSKLPKQFRDQIDGNYKDTSPCHCVLYGNGQEVIQTFAAYRVASEFAKAKAAIKKKKWQLAAFYIGAMAHYIGDLSQFMHLMGKDSRWNGGKGEDQKVHAKYEQVLEKSIEFSDRSLELIEPYIKKTTIHANEPKKIAFEVAKFTDTGGGTAETPGEMYVEILRYKKNGRLTNAEKWDENFRDQTGKNINEAVNAVAKLLKLLLSD